MIIWDKGFNRPQEEKPAPIKPKSEPKQELKKPVVDERK